MERRDRECRKCGALLEHTRTRSEQCKSCQLAEKREADILSEKARISEWGYQYLEGPWIDKFNHRCYKILTKCRHEWSLPFKNLISNVKKGQAAGKHSCGICRGK